MATNTPTNPTTRNDAPPAVGDTPAPVDFDSSYDGGKSPSGRSAKDQAKDAKDAAKDAAGQARDRASEAGDKARHEADRAKDKAHDVADKARDKARQVGDQARGQADRAKAEGQDLADQARQVGDQARQKTQETLDQARRYARDAGDKASQQWEEARHKFEQARGDLATTLQEQRHNATEKARGVVSEQKDRLAAGVADLAAAARAAAGELHDRDDETVANYAEVAANQLEQLRDYLSHADLNDLTEDLAGFARRKPEWFLGGMFVAGLAVSRFLKADVRTPYRRHDRPIRGADEGLYDDLVESQHDTGGRGRDYSRDVGGYRGASDYRDTAFVATGSDVATSGTTDDTAMPGVPAFGDDAPVGVGRTPDGAGTGTTGTASVQPEVPAAAPTTTGSPSTPARND